MDERAIPAVQARDAPVPDIHGLALADLREGRVTEFGWRVPRIRPNPVGHLAKSPGGLAKAKSRKNTEKRAVYEASLPLCHTMRGRPIWDASFPEMGAEGSSRVQALAHREQVIPAGDRMAHQSIFAGPDYPTGPNS